MSAPYHFDLRFQAGPFEVNVDTAAHYGYFEHNVLGDECGGGLWFEVNDDNQLELIDQDGTSYLPYQVCLGLRANGFSIPKEFE